jgi:uncharacterized membrane protein YidH (DUF202 family)
MRVFTFMSSSTTGEDLPATADAPDGVDPRVFLAIERTFLAWTRTALALMGFGFVVARIGLFLRELAAADPGGAVQGGVLARPSHSLWLGSALVVLGIVVQGFALLEHRYPRAPVPQKRGVYVARLVPVSVRGTCVDRDWRSDRGLPGAALLEESVAPSLRRHSGERLRRKLQMPMALVRSDSRRRLRARARQPPQHFLNFLPLPQGHGSLRPTFGDAL